MWSNEYDIQLNSQDNNGKTAFHLACQSNDSETAELLIQKSDEFNIDLNAKDKNGHAAEYCPKTS